MGAVSVRRVGYGLEVGRSVRKAGGAEAYCVATRTACGSSISIIIIIKFTYLEQYGNVTYQHYRKPMLLKHIDVMSI